VRRGKRTGSAWQTSILSWKLTFSMMKILQSRGWVREKKRNKSLNVLLLTGDQTNTNKIREY